MGKNYKNIVVLNQRITVTKDDFISLSDMLKSKDGNFFISDWLRNRNTLEFLGIRERIHNPDFNYGEFATIKSQALFKRLKKFNKIAIQQMKILVQDHFIKRLNDLPAGKTVKKGGNDE